MMPHALPNRLLFLCLASTALSMTPLTWAQQTEPEPDTLVLSDTLTYDDAARQSVFEGNVIMTRGPMKLLADKLTMREDEEGFQHGTATMNQGGLVLIEQENPENFERLEARGVRGEYNGKTEEVMVIGRAVVTRYICGKAFDNIQGERVVYNQKTNTYQAFSGPQSATPDGRVRSLARPRASADAAIAECQKKAQQ